MQHGAHSGSNQDATSGGACDCQRLKLPVITVSNLSIEAGARSPSHPSVSTTWSRLTSSLQPGRKRGVFRAELTEDLCGSRSAEFTYGTKRLDPSNLLLRAACYAMWGAETLGARPTLILPPAMKIDGEERCDLQALTEPADRLRDGSSKCDFHAWKVPLGSHDFQPNCSKMWQ